MESVTAEEATEVILRYEWLGTMPTIGKACYGLRIASGELAGVACFGKGGGTKARDICGEALAGRVICLERGACVHWAHPHSGSFLVSRACKLASQDQGWNCFYAYSDEEAGEMGTIYQACNWLYIGQSPGRAASHRSRYLQIPRPMFSSRSMRTYVKNTYGSGTVADHWPELQKAGWVRDKEIGKHKYVHFAGNARDVHEMRKALRYPPLPYPKRAAAPVNPT